MKKNILIPLALILLISCQNPKIIGETKLGATTSTATGKYVHFEPVSLYSEKTNQNEVVDESFIRKIDSINTFLLVTDMKNRVSEVYDLDSLFIGYTWNWQFEDNPATKEEIASHFKAIRVKRLHEQMLTQFGTYRGEIKWHTPTIVYIKSRLKNPSSFKREGFGYKIFDEDNSGPARVSATMLYSATNSFGGRIQGRFSALWNADGSLFKIVTDE
jgi:hypothetical protein